MKITFIGHAAILIEVQGIRILSDPWWQGPCFGSQWWIYPEPYLKCLDSIAIDYVYISHGHNDHLHPGTLRRLPQGIKILISEEGKLAPALEELGFSVIEIGTDQEFLLARDIRCRILPTCGGDTLFAITDGRETCLNINDALHAAPGDVRNHVVNKILNLYSKIDYVFCGYGIASHFPNCYRIPGKNYERTAKHRQHYFNNKWSQVIHSLSPRFGFPFAANVIFLDDALFWSNEPTHNSERPTEAFKNLYPGSPTQVLDIGPGFIIEEGTVCQNVLFEPISSDKIKREYKNDITTVNTARDVPCESVEYIADLLSRNLLICYDHLREFAGNYNFLVAVAGANKSIQIKKYNNQIHINIIHVDEEKNADYDLRLTSRFTYLRRSLATDFGHETLFVGSGCTFEYKDVERTKENLHRELAVLLRRHTTPPKSRYGDQSRLTYLAKQSVKRLIGRAQPDLYDLSAWTCFD